MPEPVESDGIERFIPQKTKTNPKQPEPKFMPKLKPKLKKRRETPPV